MTIAVSPPLICTILCFAKLTRREWVVMTGLGLGPRDEIDGAFSVVLLAGESSVRRASTRDAVAITTASWSDDASVWAISESVGKWMLSILIATSLGLSQPGWRPVIGGRTTVGGEGLKSDRWTGMAPTGWSDGVEFEPAMREAVEVDSCVSTLCPVVLALPASIRPGVSAEVHTNGGSDSQLARDEFPAN